MRSILRMTAVAGVLVAAACSDGTGPDDGGLSREDAIRIAAQIGATSSDALGMPSAAESRLAPSLSASGADPFTISQRIDDQASCPLGGVVDIDGTFEFSADEVTQSGSLETEVTIVHTDCGIPLEEGSVTVDGEPGLAASSRYAWAGGQQTEPLRVTHAGGIAWARDSGETGACEVSLVAVTDLAARTRTVEGTLCGFRIDEETAWNG